MCRTLFQQQLFEEQQKDLWFPSKSLYRVRAGLLGLSFAHVFDRERERERERERCVDIEGGLFCSADAAQILSMVVLVGVDSISIEGIQKH